MDVVRSAWEESIEEYVKRKYPALRVESNNRSIIPSRRTRRFNLEIDIFIPALCLGIEANGEPYHDREEYLRDEAHGTAHSDEMYKEEYCESVGIELIHVWSSEDLEAIQLRIDRAIQRRLSDPEIQEWDQARASGLRRRAAYLSGLVACLQFLGWGLSFGGALVCGWYLFWDFIMGRSELLDGRSVYLPFFVGLVGALLVIVFFYAEEVLKGLTPARHHAYDLLPQTFLRFVVWYVSWILMTIGALAVYFFLVQFFDLGHLSEYIVRLAAAASAGLIGLLLSRFMTRFRSSEPE
jgi:hypothetical protein